MREHGIAARVQFHSTVVWGKRRVQYRNNRALAEWQHQLINDGPKAVHPITITMNPNNKTMALKNSRATARKEKVHSA